MKKRIRIQAVNRRPILLTVLEWGITLIAAIYCRTSVDGNVSSLQEQILNCEQFCRENGYVIVGKYFDETIANVPVFQRPGLASLIESLIVNNTFLVVTEHASVISEETTYLDGFYSRLAFLNATLETIKPNSFTPLSEAPPMTMQHLKARELANITRNRMIATAMMGEIPGGKIYGYSPEKGFRTINSKEADIVNTIYELASDSYSALEICRKLNDANITSPQSEEWKPTSLLGAKARKSGVLRQTLYSGVLTFNKTTFKKHPETGKRFSIVRPVEDWIQIPLPELTIVPSDLFNKVQEVLDHREKGKPTIRRNRKAMSKDAQRVHDRLAVKQSKLKKGQTTKRQKTIYGRNLYCGKCGTRLGAERAIYYSCMNKTCDNKKIKKEALSNAIYEKLLSIPFDEFSQKFQLHLNHAEDLNRQRNNISKDLSGLETLVNTRSSDFSEKNQLVEQIQSLRFELSKISSQIDSFAINADSISNLQAIYNRFLNQIDMCVRSPNLAKEVEQIRRCIKSIIVTPLTDVELVIDLELDFSPLMFLFR